MTREEPRNQNDFRDDDSSREREGEASDLKQRLEQKPQVEEASDATGRKFKSEKLLEKREALREDPFSRKPEISDDSSECDRDQTSAGQPGWRSR